MDFKGVSWKATSIISLILISAVILWSCLFSKNSVARISEPSYAVTEPIKASSPEFSSNITHPVVQLGGVKDEDMIIQKQIDQERQEQKQTKFLRTKLEQTNLELDQEKALVQINKLRLENMENVREPMTDGKSFPEVKVQYIGGDAKKEAILSMGSNTFQVKEKSNLTDDIQVVSISNSGVTLHFHAPQELTKTIEYKPE